MKRLTPVSHYSGVGHNVIAGLLTLLAIAPAAAQSDDPQTILQHAREASSKVKSFRMDALMVTESSNQDYEQTLRSRLLIATEQPSKFRSEMKNGIGIATVSDGKETWTYNGYLKRYYKTPGETPAVTQSVTTSSVGFLGDIPSRTLTTATLAGGEDLFIGGTAYPCYILELSYPAAGGSRTVTEQRPSKVWIDKNTYLILKHIYWLHIEQGIPSAAAAHIPLDMKVTTSLEALSVNTSLPKELFTFIPPAGATLADGPASAGTRNSGLISKKSPDFTLRDLDGKEYKLSSLQGRMVLLDFWATWCKPCQALMPVLEKLHKEFGDVLFLAIDVGEEKDLVHKFAAENKMAYPVLIAGGDRISTDLHAESLPTVVVIDKNGVVRSHMTGYSSDSEQQIRAALLNAAPVEPPPLGPKVTIHRAGGGVTAPHVVYKEDPTYSEEARNAHISGTVLVSLIVGPDGLPRDIKLIRPLGKGLDENAVEAVKRWKFTPGTKDGQPVAVLATIEVNFRLLDNPPATGPGDPELERAPVTAEEAYRRGEHLARTQHLPEAIEMLDKAVAMNPTWAEALATRARVQYQSKRYTEAIDDYSEAIRLDSQKPGWYDSRGLAYSYSGRQARGIEDYNRAIALNPNVATYYNNRGWAYSEMGDPTTGLKDLAKAIELSPNYVIAFENRGQAYVKLKDWNRAIADYTAAIQLNPTTWLYQKRAEAKGASGDLAGANEDVQKGVAVRTTSSTRVPSIPPNLPAPK